MREKNVLGRSSTMVESLGNPLAARLWCFFVTASAAMSQRSLREAPARYVIEIHKVRFHLEGRRPASGRPGVWA